MLDFLRLVGTTFLVEKLCRKGVTSEAKSFIYLTLTAVTFLNEVCNSRIDKNETELNDISAHSLFADKKAESAMFSWLGNEPLKLLITNVILFKGTIAISAIASNFLY